MNKRVSYVLNMQMSTIANCYGFVTSIIRSNGEIGQVWVTWFVAPLSTYQAGSCTTSGVAMGADVAWPIQWVLKEVSLTTTKGSCAFLLDSNALFRCGRTNHFWTDWTSSKNGFILDLHCDLVHCDYQLLSCVSLIKTIPTLVNSVCVTSHNDLVFQLLLLPLPFPRELTPPKF